MDHLERSWFFPPSTQPPQGENYYYSLYHAWFWVGKSCRGTTKCFVGDESGTFCKMRENFAESHVNWIFTVGLRVGVGVFRSTDEGMLEIICYF